MYALSLLALLLPLAVANDHLKCDCMSWSEGENWIHNAVLTHYVCKTYYDGNVCVMSYKKTMSYMVRTN